MARLFSRKPWQARRYIPIPVSAESNGAHDAGRLRKSNWGALRTLHSALERLFSRIHFGMDDWGNRRLAVAERRDENSPAIYGRVKRQSNVKVPRGTAERFFRPWRDFGRCRATSPSHEWLGYFQENHGRLGVASPFRIPQGQWGARCWAIAEIKLPLHSGNSVSSSAELNGATRAPLVSPLLPLQTQRRFCRNRAGAPPTRLLMWYPGLASKIACENSPADYDAGESARLGI